MSGIGDRLVLLTGASGTLGRLLAQRLGLLGWRLRLTDKVAFPDPLPAHGTFDQLDLEDAAEVDRVAEGCGVILHFGGISTEQPFETICGPNIRGSFNVYEAARRHGARVVFASSNHVVGLYERSVHLDHDCVLRPDGYYGMSKAYGEMLGRLYWEKHGVESILIRIGSVTPTVVNERMLSTWLSHNDFTSLIECCVGAGPVGCPVIWGASNNTRSFWGRDAREEIGWKPSESADNYADAVLGVITDDPVAERFQGSVFASSDYSRSEVAPRDMFSPVKGSSDREQAV